VQGALLVPPRPQVSAFLGRLAEMSAAAEAALAGVKDGSAAVSRDLGALGAEGQALHDLVNRRLLPALAAQGREAEARVARQADLAALTAARAADVAAVRAEVGRIVHGLQAGDATRQRLDNAARAIDPAPPHNGPGSLGARLRLAAVLIRGALADVRAPVATALDALQAIRALAGQAVGPAATGFLDRASEVTAGIDLGDPDLPRRHLEAMRVVVARLTESFRVIVGLEGTLSRIAQEVRLAGLNATVICARLGREGRALRELAQWLHGLTDESDAIVLRLQDNITAAGDLARRLGSEQIDGLAEGLADVATTVPRLVALTRAGASTVAAARATVGQAGRSVPAHLDAAEAALTGFAGASGVLATLADQLEATSMGLPDGPDTADALIWLRTGYTMPAERLLHDAATRAVPQDGAPAEVLPPEEVIETEQTLDDIFF
jgi:methyl-accepting chemotaxis protein